MIDVKLDAPVWVDKPSQLKQVINGLKNAPSLAIDTESNGLHAYREQVCLIQISDGETDYLLDTLSLKDLSPLGELLCNDSIEKIFHACEYDILCLKRDYGFRFCNIFDTMIASRILGVTAVGLGAILEANFGIVLDKRYQQANWGQRPLTQAMLEYARRDVHFLIPLREQLKARLIENERWQLAQEDFRRICQVQSRQETMTSLDLTWKVIGQAEINPVQAAVLKELLEYRETYARAHNLPSYKVLNNQVLLEIVQNAPTTREDLVKNCNISPILVDRHGNSIIAAVNRGLNSPPLFRPQRQRPDSDFLVRLDTLRSWRKYTAQSMKVESDVILPRDLMETIAAKNPRDPASLQNIMQEIPWRFDHYGSKILATLNSNSI